MKLIIGLGNPGAKYKNTRHNIGFLVVEELAKRNDIEFHEKTSYEAWCAQTEKNGNDFLLCKPQTFMNASGNAVKKVMKKLNLKTEDVLIIYDDADLPFGEIRFKTSGSSGGHNGMQSIIDLFPNKTPVARVRVGIGRPMHTDVQLETWVLSKWTEKELAELPQIISKAADIAEEHIL